jgi:hypothetical protein
MLPGGSGLGAVSVREGLFGGWKRVGEIFRYACGSSRVEIEHVIRDKGAGHRWVDFARVGYRVEVQILFHHTRGVRKQKMRDELEMGYWIKRNGTKSLQLEK